MRDPVTMMSPPASGSPVSVASLVGVAAPVAVAASGVLPIFACPAATPGTNAASATPDARIPRTAPRLIM